MTTRTTYDYDRYIRTWNGEQLLRRYSLDQEGLWQIRGEDPNCDMGGSHHQPDLGLVEGKLRDVIEYGVELSGFWQWGAGGTFTLLNQPKKIDPETKERRKQLKERLSLLEAEVAAIKKELE